MVDALREARRVLSRRGVLIDLRPLVAPIVVEVMVAAQTTWTREVATYNTPENVAAADAAVETAISSDWFVFEKRIRFDFEIYCDTAAELSNYAQDRTLDGEEIPYEELENRQAELRALREAPRLRCRRRWMLSTYRKR
jgi:hypothetical protein